MHNELRKGKHWQSNSSEKNCQTELQESKQCDSKPEV